MSPGKPINPKNRKSLSGKKISCFAINLQRLRLEKGMTQDDLGSKIGVSLSQVSQYEGGVFPTTPERIVAIADALDCTCDELLRPRP